MFILRFMISICIIYGGLGAITQEQCSQSLVSLLETKKESQIADLFKQCAAHGTPEQQLKNAKTLAQSLKKHDVEKTINQKLQETKPSEEVSQGLTWWQWLGLMWAGLGICVASQKAIEDHYEQESIDEENEEWQLQEKLRKEKLKRKQAV